MINAAEPAAVRPSSRQRYVVAVLCFLLGAGKSTYNRVTPPNKERIMVRARRGFLVSFVTALFIVAGLACHHPALAPASGERYVHDPKMKETLVDVFPGMDGPNLNLTQEDIRGRIVWNLWVGDSGLMWDYLAQHGFGTADLLKTIDSRRRAHRFAEMGIINQPGFQTATKPDQYGLFIDEPKPGDPDGQIDSKIDDYTYGRSSGVVGLRISRNPKFDTAAEKKWMERVRVGGGVNRDFYENPGYFNKPDLVRPYIVGMACAFCHVGPDPVRPPADPENPKWSNLNDYVGAQYLKVWAVFVPPNPKTGKDEEDSFVWQLIHSNPQGTLDTSFIATDYLNNPGTMNGIYSLGERVKRAAKAVSNKPAAYDPMIEYLTGGALDLRNIKEHMDKDLVIPRVLKQGDDSVGLAGALSRVYVNIGEAWPESSKHFQPLIGGPGFDPSSPLRSQTPVPVKTLQQTSAAWNWSEERSPYLANYLIKVAQPLLLKDAPGGAAYLKATPEQLDRGKIVFAENCARCHSSKQPPEDVDPRSPAGIEWFRQQVQSDPNYFTRNFLSDERRKRVTDIGTNATRAAGTNAMGGHIWDNFSSETYKTLPKVQAFQVDNPFDASKPITIDIAEGGPGYYRPPSLISLWSSAPYLHNNTVGKYVGDPSVDGRMKAFQDGIERMLFIQPRENIIWRTTKTSYIHVPLAYLPEILQGLIKQHPDLIDVGQNVKIGPIPRGTPINLISNTNLDAGLDLAVKRLELFNSIVDALVDIQANHLNEEQATEVMRQRVVPKFLAVNKCADFVEDKGHEFGRNLPLADKKALIELLKTF
jgi:mono/diheme cytochrome c family protein